MEQEPKLYEISYIAGPEEEKKAGEFADSLKSIIIDNHGIVVSASQPKFRTLAYPINKKNGGYFGWLKFLLNTDLLSEIKKYLLKEKDLMRFLLIKLDRQMIEEPAKKKIPKKKMVLPEEKRVDIEEIDKKLEEILGI